MPEAASPQRSSWVSFLPSNFMDAIVVALRNASAHLGKMQVFGVKRKA